MTDTPSRCLWRSTSTTFSHPDRSSRPHLGLGETPITPSVREGSGWRLSDRRRPDSPLFLARDDGGSDGVDGGHPRRLCALERNVCKRRDGSGMGADRAAAPSRATGRPAAVGILRRVVNAVFYLLQTGCQWRMLPRDFPPRSTVYGYFRAWIAAGVWAHIHDVLYRRTRELEGREESPSAAIIDSQSVKTSADAREMVGFDAGKRDQGPQTAPGHRHAWPDAAHRGPFRQHAGSRRRGVGPRPDHPPLPFHRTDLRRRRLSRPSRCRRRAAASPDHQAHRSRLRRPAQALGDRTDLRMGMHQPPPRKGLRTLLRDRAEHCSRSP